MAGGLALFLLVLPFHLVVKTMIPGPVGTYWKEVLLGLLVLLWTVHCLVERRLFLTNTPLDGAVFLYAAALLLRCLLDRSGRVGAWGLYVSILYLPLFWLVPTVLDRWPRWTMAVVTSLVGVAVLAAAGGLAEFSLNRPLWPSAEMVVRQGFPDVFIYGTHVRRVYFTFDSPTTLANTLGMLLPLTLGLFLVARRRLTRLLAALAAALISAGIVVTFSRGVWVATAFALAVMLVSCALLRRSWKPLLLAAGVLVLFLLVWGLVLSASRGRVEDSDKGVVELSAAAFEQADVTLSSQDLLTVAPMVGELIAQTWSLLDPIANQEDMRAVLYQHPPPMGKGEIIYRVQVPEQGALRFAIALSPEVWSPQKGDGASFQIWVSNPAVPNPGRAAFVRYINPKSNPSDRRWRNFLVDLSPWAGQTVDLSLITEAGPNGDWAFDWAGWAGLQVVAVPSAYFAPSAAEDTVLRHTRSVADWATDETNRDRLAAWSLALNAWRAAPWWGQGLGSTGVAALRTQPERAFVTESQVLKALVELGPLGLLVLGYLWFQTARVGIRAVGDSQDVTHTVLLLAILTGLLVVFVEGWVYQNLEVKQVNAYFWTLLGTLAFLAHQPSLAQPGSPGPGLIRPARAA